jgi:hypothetical protein
MACDDERQSKDDATDRMTDATDKAENDWNDAVKDFADYQQAYNDYWNSLNSDDPDAAADAYFELQLAEEKLTTDYEAAGESLDGALDSFDEWDSAMEDWCNCLAAD